MVLINLEPKFLIFSLSCVRNFFLIYYLNFIFELYLAFLNQNWVEVTNIYSSLISTISRIMVSFFHVIYLCYHFIRCYFDGKHI